MVSYQCGIHTVCFSLTKQGYAAIQGIINEAYKKKYQITKQSDKFGLDNTYHVDQYADQGIRVTIKQTCSHPGYVKLIVSPGSLISQEYNPIRLYQATDTEWKTMNKRFRRLISIKGLPDSLEQYAITRVDVTMDLYLETHEEVMEWVRIFKKSMKSPRYQLHEFTKKTANDPKEANRHSCEYCTSTSRKNKSKFKYSKQPETAFKAYDKFFEVNDSDILDKPVLRLELSLSRQSLIKKLHLKTNVDNKELLWEAASNSTQLICKYLKRNMFINGEILTYNAAMERIDNSTKLKSKFKEDMKEMVRKCSDSDSLYNALQKIGNSKRQDALLKQFKKIGISPVTLTGRSALEELPGIMGFLNDCD